MKKLFADILIIIGTIGLIVLSLIGAGILLYMLFTHQLGILIYTSFSEGWIALILTIFSIISAILYSLYTLRAISLGRTTKKSLYFSLLFLLLEISRIIFIFVKIKDFDYMNFFVVIFILILIFFFIQFIGCFFNYKKRY